MCKTLSDVSYSRFVVNHGVGEKMHLSTKAGWRQASARYGERNGHKKTIGKKHCSCKQYMVCAEFIP